MSYSTNIIDNREFEKIMFTMMLRMNCMKPNRIFIGNNSCPIFITQENIGYNIANHTVRMDGGNITSLSKNLTGLVKLNQIAALKENWNENGAPAFNKQFIEEMKDILIALPIQPEVFPTANESIQFEYEKDNGSYLEFELFENGAMTIYQEPNNDKENLKNSPKIDVDKIIEVINSFYE